MENKDGVIYILTNPSFPKYVKIGYSDNVNKRLEELNRSECIPFAFRLYAYYKVENRLSDKKVHELMNNEGIIRNKLKIKASIKNSIVFQNIQKEFGSFDKYIWSFTDRKIIKESFEKRTSSPLSDTISKDLKKRGMSFVGTTIIYSYLQAVGYIYSHDEECDLYRGG